MRTSIPLLVITWVLAFAIPVPLAGASPDVQINVGVFAPPPAFVVPSPPPVVVVPGTYVYSVPDISVDIMFYHGHWYRPYEGRWYRSGSYNGPWAYVASTHVPHAVVSLPPGYYRIPPGHQKIPYGQLKKNWAKWEKDKHWHKDKDWQEARHDGSHDRNGNGHGKGHSGKGKGKGHD
jgi:hypothetical protein